MMYKSLKLVNIVQWYKLLVRMGSELYLHEYTVVDQIMVCLDKFDIICRQEIPFFEVYSKVFQLGEQPEVLYLATLQFNIVKFSEYNHAEYGATIAAKVACSLGLDIEATEEFIFLVRNHLEMVDVLQKRDLDDPQVINDFANKVGCLDKLYMQTLLTVAVAIATNKNYGIVTKINSYGVIITSTATPARVYFSEWCHTAYTIPPTSER